MADEREHIERHGIAVELVEIFADGKLRAAILSDRDSCDALRNLRRCGRVLVQATTDGATKPQTASSNVMARIAN